MTGARTGVGIVFGAAFGLLFGQTMFLFGHMLFANLWIGPMIGVAAGLIIGAVADLLAAAGDRVDHHPS